MRQKLEYRNKASETLTKTGTNNKVNNNKDRETWTKMGDHNQSDSTEESKTLSKSERQ
jgi:hypothetical protein